MPGDGHVKERGQLRINLIEWRDSHRLQQFTEFQAAQRTSDLLTGDNKRQMLKRGVS